MTHYTRLNEIKPSNLSRLRIAWTFDTGDAFDGSEMECNPIVERGVLFATTPKVRVIALNAATGKLLWSFDPQPPGRNPKKARNRGLNFWTDGHQERLFFAVGDKLFALDAKTGRPVDQFGSHGVIDLRSDLGRPPEDINISLTTPGVIYKDRLILGSITSEDLPAAPGDIRAYNVRDGHLEWSFHTIPHPGEPSYDTWPQDAWKYSGAANDWAGMALDDKRGIVFVPLVRQLSISRAQTGSAMTILRTH